MYQVGQVIKIVRASTGAAVVVATITQIGDGMVAARLADGGTYHYSFVMIAPATEQDIINAAAWSKHLEEMRNPKPVASTMQIPEGWDLCDEDGVLIA